MAYADSAECAELEDVIRRKDEEIVSLRAQIAQRIDPRSMLMWEDGPHDRDGDYKTLYLAGMWIAEIRPGDNSLWYWRTSEHRGEPCNSEPEARAAVEKAILSAFPLCTIRKCGLKINPDAEGLDTLAIVYRLLGFRVKKDVHARTVVIDSDKAGDRKADIRRISLDSCA